MDRASNKSLGYGFVDFVDPEAAQTAVAAVNGMRLVVFLLACLTPVSHDVVLC